LPITKCQRDKGKGTSNKKWVIKHSRFDQSVSVAVWTNMDYHSGSKGITLFLLCRLGIAKVKTHRAFNLAQWNVDIGPLSESEIMALYQNMISWIKRDGKYGGYDAV